MLPVLPLYQMQQIKQVLVDVQAYIILLWELEHPRNTLIFSLIRAVPFYGYLRNRPIQKVFSQMNLQHIKSIHRYNTFSMFIVNFKDNPTWPLSRHDKQSATLLMVLIIQYCKVYDQFVLSQLSKKFLGNLLFRD